eukprot:scaffold341_cov154-Ochromonas_danica.AAC.20
MPQIIFLSLLFTTSPTPADSSWLCCRWSRSRSSRPWRTRKVPLDHLRKPNHRDDRQSQRSQRRPERFWRTLLQSTVDKLVVTMQCNGMLQPLTSEGAYCALEELRHSCNAGRKLLSKAN